MIQLRRAFAADANVAARIIARCLAEYGLPFDPEGRDADVARFGSRDDHDDFVAEREDSPVGIVSVGPHGDPEVAWISKVFVVAESRRGGVGLALLDAAHEAAAKRGYRRIGLRTRDVFVDAIRLYVAAGYELSQAPPSPGNRIYFRAL